MFIGQKRIVNIDILFLNNGPNQINYGELNLYIQPEYRHLRDESIRLSRLSYPGRDQTKKNSK